jgi:hypothetical protein
MTEQFVPSAGPVLPKDLAGPADGERIRINLTPDGATDTPEAITNDIDGQGPVEIARYNALSLDPDGRSLVGLSGSVQMLCVAVADGTGSGDVAVLGRIISPMTVISAGNGKILTTPPFASDPGAFLIPGGSAEIEYDNTTDEIVVRVTGKVGVRARWRLLLIDFEPAPVVPT